MRPLSTLPEYQFSLSQPLLLHQINYFRHARHVKLLILGQVCILPSAYVCLMTHDIVIPNLVSNGSTCIVCLGLANLFAKVIQRSKHISVRVNRRGTLLLAEIRRYVRLMTIILRRGFIIITLVAKWHVCNDCGMCAQCITR